MNRFFWLQTIGIAALTLAFAGCQTRNGTGAISTEHSSASPENTGVETFAPVKKRGGPYVLRPTDALSVEMYMDPALRVQQVRITSIGEIILPMINNVKISGLTLHEAQEKINDLYRKFYKTPNVILTITQYAERRVYVSGFVNRAGPVSIPPEEEMTLGRAISAAGGTQPRASRTEVTVTRTTKNEKGEEYEETFKINLKDIETGKTNDFDLMENDKIYVRDSIV